MPEFRQYRRRLPHWRLRGGIYFVTWRLERGVRELDGAERDEVLASLRHFNGVRYALYACVVMNDHVHALVQPLEGYELEDILRSWKGFTARRLQRHGRAGRIWQPEYWDRLIRDEDEFLGAMRYVAGNPFARWQGIESYPWMWITPPSGTG